MLKRHKYMLIPIELIETTIKESTYNRVKVLLILKTYSTGKIKLETKTVKFLSNQINISPSTFWAKLKELKEINWVGQDSNGMNWIRGIDNIRKIEQYDKRLAAWLDKAFCAGAIIKSIIRSIPRNKRSPGAKLGRIANQPGAPLYFNSETPFSK